METIKFDPNMTKFIVGKEGSNIKKFQETGAKISIDKDQGVLVIKGKPEQVNESKKKIQAFIVSQIIGIFFK